MIPVIFWGATGQAKVLREALSNCDTKLLALFDNRAVASPFSDVPIFQGEAGFLDWERAYRGDRPVSACVAIGGDKGRDRLERMRWLRERGYRPCTVVHERAFVARDADVPDGCQILAMSSVCSGATLGEAVIVNTAASVDHDCTIGHGVHVAPGARLAGEVIVGDYVFIGTGAIVLPRVQIGANVTVGAGAVVTHDIAAGEIVAGNPAHRLRPSAT